VAGAATPDQVRANVAALTTEVPDELWARLRDEDLLP
jgi:aryl-alcohol dehydrogenase-like predicted oxidoreductase